MKTGPLARSIVLSSLALLLTACSDSGEEHEDAFTEEENYPNEYRADNVGDVADGWRKGTLGIELLVNQTGVYNETSENTPSAGSEHSSNIQWSYNLNVNTSLDVEIPEDLSVYMPEGSDGERYDYLTSSPFYETGDSDSVQTFGELTYQLDYSMESPSAADVKQMEKHITGTGTEFFLNLTHMQPSIFGQGYEFTLKLDYDYSQEGALKSIDKNGNETTLDLADVGSEEFRFDVFPQPNDDGLNDYPYLYEERQVMDQQSLQQLEKIKFGVLSQLQEIATGQVDFIHQMHVGAVTTMTEDLLVVEYHYDGTNVLPLMGGLDTLVAKPKTSEINIVITLKPQ